MCAQQLSKSQSFDDIPALLLDIKAVSRRVSLSRSCIYRLIREQKFPAPLKLTPYASRWPLSEVDAGWIESRIQVRGEA